VLLLAIIALGVPLAINLSARVNAEVRTQALAQADLVAATAADLLGPSERAELATLARTAATSIRGRVLVVNARGTVLADSAVPPQVGVSYDSRPEILSALQGRQVQVLRNSKTLGQAILASAVPIVRNRRPAGAVRVTQSVAAVHSAVRRAELGLVLIAVSVLALGLLAGVVIAAQVSQPLRRLEAVARRVAHGDLRARAEVAGSREQRSLSRSFNEMTDRVARLLAAQREFVADASHQLRTPLTGLRLRLEEAKANIPKPDAGAELDAAIAEVDRLSHTVDELLVLSRAGERELTGAPVDLTDLAASAARRWQAGAIDAGIALEHQDRAQGATVWAAAPDLERALDALLENALRYSRSGTTVTIVSAPGRIEVRDRGPGVTEDERELVFERFHRGHAGRSGPAGDGLGLPIARELTRAWGGQVTISPRAGGGAIATLSIASVPAAEGGRPASEDPADFARV
jgi:signal transduction histidine kinase